MSTDHRSLLEDIYQKALKSKANLRLLKPILTCLDKIAKNIPSQKGVYTVLITLAIHKALKPRQDIRYHQRSLPNGFSGRTIDTEYITPFLKEKGLTSMAESGWLTRSLEQSSPYNKNYKGNISKVKKEFLSVVDFLQRNPNAAQQIVHYLLSKDIEHQNKNKIKISPLKNPEKIEIGTITRLITEFVNFKFSTSGGSKIPVIAIHAIYQQLVGELARYKGAELAKLGSHVASDLTSNTSGDIEIYSGGNLLEVLEIKHGQEIDVHMINRAIEKIKKFNPKRYYILSTSRVDKKHKRAICKKIAGIRNKHGCHVIVNGVIETLKYYLRLIEDPYNFIERFNDSIENDSELKSEHKRCWENILKKQKLI